MSLIMHRPYPLQGNCDCSGDRPIANDIVFNAGKLLAEALVAMEADGTLPTVAWDCDNPSGSNATREAFDDVVREVLDGPDSAYLFKRDKYGVPLITAPIEIEARTRNRSTDVLVGRWNPMDRFVQSDSYERAEIKRFFRVGEFQLLEIHACARVDRCS